MEIIGITGGIASGKSTVVKLLKKRYNFEIIDADQLAREAVKKGSRGLRKIVDTFGERILTDQKELDRQQMGEMIAENQKVREELNAIVHPEVKKLYDQEIEELKKTNFPYIFYDCPLLCEVGLTKTVDEIFLIVANREVRLKRIVERDHVSVELAQKKIDMQMKDEEKEKIADIIIENNGTKNDLLITLDCYLSKRKLWTKNQKNT
ncbi:dephospho-CoA kinase [Eubacteriaceae bacterium ES2]|nr:dephospho-CoA kinase [Eubacteriaceae bacterium ES2]